MAFMNDLLEPEYPRGLKSAARYVINKTILVPNIDPSSPLAHDFLS